MSTVRIDHLPMDRQSAGYGRRNPSTSASLVSPGGLHSVFEARDVDPSSAQLQRRTGSRRSQSAAPNLLGVAADIDLGAVAIDYDFSGDISSDWTVFATVRCPANSEIAASPLFKFSGMEAYVYFESTTTNVVSLRIYDTATGALQVNAAMGDLDSNTDYRIMVRRATATLAAVAWAVPADGGSATIGAETTATPTFTAVTDLELIGSKLTSGALSGIAAYDRVVTTNFLLYENSDFDKDTEFETFAADISPSTTESYAGGTATLAWHDALSAGGTVLSYTNAASTTIYSYLTPTLPSVATTDWIHFGGKGVIEVPFYSDFDEYYWTASKGTARLSWLFQIELTLPAILSDSTIFEFQDILRLNLTASTGFLDLVFADGVTLAGTDALTAGTTYWVFVGRDATTTYLTIQTSAGVAVGADTGTAGNPAIFNYDKQLGFVIGDTADQQNSQPFGGQIKRFAFTNSATIKWHPLKDAVLYYDANSVFGDQILDRGNRALNSFSGVRVASAPPIYLEGGFKGGTYVAAVGGYTLAVSTPDSTYTGELSKALTKDATVQRRGSKAFLNSNGVNYVLDDIDLTYRPLGIPRPATKVSCTPQGVGVLDGFVRYAYRWITKDGTVGPAFSLDPVDARGGVNVFLGAVSFGPPGETPWGISFGECELASAPVAPAAGDIETFLFKDKDNDTGTPLLGDREIKNPGLTLEVAARIPDATEVEETVFSQGVTAPTGVANWGAVNTNLRFPWIGGSNQECTFQFCFRFSSNDSYQTLFAVGPSWQRYASGKFSLHHLVVSIQPYSAGSNGSANQGTHSIVVCRDRTGGDNNDDLKHYSWDYTFQDGRDYCVLVRRTGTAYGEAAGSRLSVSIYDADAAAGTEWQQWPLSSTDSEKFLKGFWPSNYKGNAADELMWGTGRRQNTKMDVKTRKRSAAGSNVFNYDHVGAIAGNGTSDTVLYHGRAWQQDHDLQVIASRGLERYGARSGPLAKGLEADIAFCPDSSVSQIDGGWDEQAQLRGYFWKEGGGKVNGLTTILENVTYSPILTYGWDMRLVDGVGWSAATLDDVPLWAAWTSRNNGSIVIGVGDDPSVEVATRKWHAGSGVTLFSDLGGAIDFKSFTWITLYIHHITRTGATSVLDVWLERVFLDGISGPWGDVYAADLNGVGIVDNTAGSNADGLYMVGGFPPIAQQYDVEIAEVRLWDGERYTSAAGEGDGDELFGPYMSTRVPPNLWDKLWHYGRFMKDDVDDPDSQSTMDQVGTMSRTGENPQLSTDAVPIQRTAEVVDETPGTGTNYYVPFPEPPLAGIRGIEIFRTQVIPVTDNFPNGNPNPNAVSDAWRACRDAPLYYLTEIPRGTNSYTDFADDTALGTQLDQLTGLVPRNPKGIFEWEGHLGVFVEDEPRIHFSESPSSWESFPLDMVYDLPVKEQGTVQAAAEIGSRDARQSRVLVLGESWGVFLDGTPTSPQANTLGGGVGASSARCLVVEKGIAYAYNGTLWAITGDGQAKDIGLPVLDLLPATSNARLSVSSALSSLFVIDESTGLALRYYFPRQRWYVEDRYALSVTDKDGSDYWVHVSGFPSLGTAGVYQDDVDSGTPSTAVSVTSYTGSTATLGSVTGISVGQRITLVGDRDDGSSTPNAHHRQTLEVASISGLVVTFTAAVTVPASFTDLGGTSRTLAYNAYIGVGYWGTMLDTGQFDLRGTLNHVRLGITDGSDWWAASDASDYAVDPTDRSRLDNVESTPALIGATSALFSLSNAQRLGRFVVWTPAADLSALSEAELTITPDPGRNP